MPVTYHHFESYAPILWRWPLEVGLTNNAAPLQKYLSTGTAGQFIKPVILDKVDASVNLMLLTNGLSQGLKDTSGKLWKADVVLVFSNEKTISATIGDERLQEMVKQVCQNLHASGFFMVSPKTDIQTFIASVVLQLSHNINIVQAIRRTTDNGYFSYDKRIEDETQLSFLLKTISHGLQFNHYSPALQIHVSSAIFGEQTFSPVALSSHLTNMQGMLRFDHESQSAFAIKQLTTTMYATFGHESFLKGEFHRLKTVTPPSSEILGYFEVTYPDFNPENIVGNEENFIVEEPKRTEYPRFDYSELKRYLNKERSKTANEGTEDKPIDPEDLAKPRFLQAKIFSALVSKQITDFLIPQLSYLFKIRIGFDGDSWSSPATPIDTDRFFENSKTQSVEIDIVFIADHQKSARHSKVLLPKVGVSSTAEFAITAPSNAAVFVAYVEAYYKNELLQKICIEINLREPGKDNGKDGIKVTTVYSPVKQLAELASRTPCVATIQYKQQSTETSLTGMMEAKPLSLYFSSELSGLMEEIKNLIQSALISYGDKPAPLHSENNTTLLRTLAIKGNKLFVQYLKKEKLPDGAVQVVSDRPGFVPLDFVYELAPPGLDAPLCEHAVDALNAGKCAGCYDRMRSPATHVCPFGFWGFNRIIERYAHEKKEGIKGDYQILQEPVAARNILEIMRSTLYASSSRVNSTAAPDIRAQVSLAMQKFCVSSISADDWDTWTNQIKDKKPDSLVLIVHVEKEPQVNEDQVEIGDGKFLLQNFLDSSRIMPEPPEHAPFVIILGCSTSDVLNQGFDLSDKLMTEGAAIVISSFTKIRGRQAGPVVIKLLELLSQLKGKEIMLGEVLLHLRRYFLAMGSMISLALVVHGDANWKIKT